MSVYFITAREVGRVKIGCAYDPGDRMDKLQIGSPVKLTLEAAMRGSYGEENELHARFAAHRLHGEWFTITPEIELIISTYRVSQRLTKEEIANLAPGKAPKEPYEKQRWREGQRVLRKRLEAGDIHFPFRAKEDA